MHRYKKMVDSRFPKPLVTKKHFYVTGMSVKRVHQIFCMTNCTKAYQGCDYGSKLEVLNVPVMSQQHSDMEAGMSPNEPGWLI